MADGTDGTMKRTIHPFLARVQDTARGPLLFDGATGTLLHLRGDEPMDSCFVALNKSRPDLVSALHREYIAAGAEAIKTNTFAGNRFQLELHGWGDEVRDLNKRAAKLARDAREISGQAVWIAGSVGPTGRLLAPIGTSTVKDIRAAFREQIEVLVEGGVDVLLLETFSSLAEIREAIAAARDLSDLPIIASMTYADDDRTPVGHAPRDVARELTRLGVDVIGANCSVGPQNVTRVALTLREATHLPISAMPNAGWPANLNGRIVYASSPSYLAAHARQAAEAGVRILGGCCGTEPAHTAAMRQALDALIALDPQVARHPNGSAVAITMLPAAEADTSGGESACGSAFGRKLARGEFVVTVEVAPPRGLNPAKVLAGARLLKEAGVDAVDVTDSARARLAMSPIATCTLIQQQVGIDTIIHLTTRDRSLMGLQADLLGAHALGLRNVLALTGDPPSLGNYPNSTAVYDVDSVGLIGILQRMNEGVDIGGNPIGAPAGFTIACGVDPTRDDLHEEARRLRRKIEAGAQFVMAQPIFDLDRWHRLLDIYGPIPIPVLLGVLPLQNTRHAEFLHNEVPGIVLTDRIRQRMADAGNDGRHVGIALAQELIVAARDLVQGIYMMPSFGRYEQAAAVLSVIREPAAGD
jgi:methionine synthase / methylenetetrahydrofolate reductase(NADPH)